MTIVESLVPEGQEKSKYMTVIPEPEELYLTGVVQESTMRKSSTFWFMGSRELWTGFALSSTER